MSGEASDPRAVIHGLCAAISPASRAQATGAARRLAPRAGESHDLLERLAIWLAAARHSPRPSTEHKRVVVVAADHGVGDPGVDLGALSPTIAALEQLAAGDAALCAAARRVGAKLVLIDAGAWSDTSHISGLVDLRLGSGTADITAGPAMPEAEAARALAHGVAIVFSLAEEGLDIACLGALGVGAEVASTALIAALTGQPPESIGGPDAAAAAAALARDRVDPKAPLALLANFAGYEIAVLTGVVLAAAAISVPVVLDDHASGAAALVARALAPAAADYVLASHIGSHPAHRAAIEALGLELEPLLSVGVSRGEGTGATLALPALDAAAGLLAST
jgi:nicotinate-nucleotide--dimethylbenzimidazole phosphoribosyltransferase